MTAKRWWICTAVLLLIGGVWWATRKRKPDTTGEVDFTSPQVNFNPNATTTSVGQWNPLYQKIDEAPVEETLLQRLTRESAETIRAHDEAEMSTKI